MKKSIGVQKQRAQSYPRKCVTVGEQKDFPLYINVSFTLISTIAMKSNKSIWCRQRICKVKIYLKIC